MTVRRVTDLTDLEGCLIQRVALEIDILPPLRSRMLTSVSPFFLISLLMVSVYLSCVLHLGIISFTPMSSILLVIIVWLASLRLTCPYQRSRFCIRCVVIRALNCCCLPDLFISFVLSQANALYPPQHSHFSLIHEPLVLLFHCPAFSPICHSRINDRLIDFINELEEYFLVTVDSRYLLN